MSVAQCIRKEMDSHVREKPEDHLSYIGDAMLAFRRVINEQHETIETHKTKLAAIDARVGPAPRRSGRPGTLTLG